MVVVPWDYAVILVEIYAMNFRDLYRIKDQLHRAILDHFKLLSGSVRGDKAERVRE